MATDSDDDVPRLPADTLAILQQFRDAQHDDDASVDVPEDWQLSQFWYDEGTARALCSEILSVLEKENDEATPSTKRVAIVSAPTLMKYLFEHEGVRTGDVYVLLFEFDERFREKYPQNYCFFDYNTGAQDLPTELQHSFDFVIADPPFLSEECMTKTALAIRAIAKSTAKILVCTGAVVEKKVHELLGCTTLPFIPQHERNLGNEFRCYANYPSTLGL